MVRPGDAAATIPLSRLPIHSTRSGRADRLRRGVTCRAGKGLILSGVGQGHPNQPQFSRGSPWMSTWMVFGRMRITGGMGRGEFALALGAGGGGRRRASARSRPAASTRAGPTRLPAEQLAQECELIAAGVPKA